MKRKYRIMILFCLAGIFAVPAGFAQAQSIYDSLLWEADFEMLAKAKPDECFSEIGAIPGIPPCTDGLPKVNDAYIWSMAKPDADHIWFGTNANTLCEVLGGFLGVSNPLITDDFVCEFGASIYSPPRPPSAGDWRPGRIYTYDKSNAELVDRTPELPDAITTTTTGWRASGTNGQIVFFGGPARALGTGLPTFINMVAFDVQTGAYIGGRALPPYTNIRQFHLAADGNLYAGVRRADVTTSGVVASGRVIRWVSNPASPLYPFQFEEVGVLDGEPANITEFNGALWATTWPALNAGSGEFPPFGVYRGPVLPPGGLTAEDRQSWQKVWNYGDYDHDPIHAALTGGGDLMAHDGWLYFGTMHVPMLQAVVAQDLGATNTLDLVVNGHRAISVFRLREVNGPGSQLIETQCLWGRSELSVYDVEAKQYGSGRTPTGYTPIYGDWGFGNLFNNYAWAMAEHDGLLYIGTMDWSYLAESIVEDALKNATPQMIALLEHLGLLDGMALKKESLSSFAPGNQALIKKEYNPSAAAATSAVNRTRAQIPGLDFEMPPAGFDLWATDGEEWVAVTDDGMGNAMNYGARNLLSDGRDLYVGTANPMNLHPNGGWELHRGGLDCHEASLTALNRWTACEAEIEVVVGDCDLNTTSGLLEYGAILAQSTSHPSPEVVQIQEQYEDSKYFWGIVPITDQPTTPGLGIVQVQHGDTLTVTYIDENDGTGRAAVRKLEFQVDCAQPVVFDVKVLYAGVNSAFLQFRTNELAIGRLWASTDCAAIWGGEGEIYKEEAAETNTHIFQLTGLSPNTAYSFVPGAWDMAFNSSLGAEVGECFSFRTKRECEKETIRIGGILLACGAVTEVTLSDCDSNTSDSLIETAVAFVNAVDPSTDEIVSTTTLELSETEPDSGVFTGPLTFASDGAPQQNNVIQVRHGVEVVAYYFNDEETTPTYAMAYVDCEPPKIMDVAFNEVTDSTAILTFRTNEPAWASVDVATACMLTGNMIYEGELPLLNHRIELTGLEPGTLYACQLMVVDLTGQNMFLDNNNWECYTFETGKGCSDALLSLEGGPRAGCNSEIGVCLTDCGANASSTTLDRVLVVASSATEPGGEVFELQENDVDSGIFHGVVRLSSATPAAGDGYLQVADGDTVRVLYKDPDDGIGNPQEVSAEREVDCRPPEILDVQVAQVTENSALIQVVLDAPALVELDYSTSCGVSMQRVSIPEQGTVVLVPIGSLQKNTVYYFSVVAIDAKGNAVYADNGGVCYSFRTLGTLMGNDLWLISQANGPRIERSARAGFSPAAAVASGGGAALSSDPQLAIASANRLLFFLPVARLE